MSCSVSDGIFSFVAVVAFAGMVSACFSASPVDELVERENAGSADGPPAQIVVDSGRVVVSDAVTDLSIPVAMDIDAAGNLWVVDRRLSQVLVVSADGSLLRTIGRNGEGPGEFRAPRGIGLRGDLAWVLDNVHGVQAFDMQGEYAGEYAAPRILFDFDFTGDGGIVASNNRVWMRGGLVVALGPDGEERGLIGEPPFPDLEDFNFGALREQMLQGMIPDALRNGSLPVVAPDGTLWVVSHTEAVIRRYGSDGARLLETAIDVPELDGIEQRFYEDFQAAPANDVFFYPSFVADGFATESHLLLLWDTVEGDPGLVTVHDGGGAIVQRWLIPDLDMGGGGFTVLSMALDESARSLYVSVSDIATVFGFDLPEAAAF